MSFSNLSPSANPVFFRTYSRKKENNQRESFQEAIARVVSGLQELGKLTDVETAIITENLRNLRCFPSGRWMWVGGTEWVKQPENFPGAYNCSSTNVDSWEAFGYIMDLAMQGCGTGAVLETKHIQKLPVIKSRLNVEITSLPGSLPEGIKGDPDTELMHSFSQDKTFLIVGDSRKGWVDAYLHLLKLAANPNELNVNLCVNLANVRPAGVPLKGFGGTANPSKLPELFTKVADILNQAIGRQLNSVECALIINEAALVVVAGNIRRSANIQQGDKDDHLFATAKDNLWQQDEHGNWSIDPLRDALRMANLTRVYHSKPSLKECIESVRKQFYSGEGAIQYAPEAIVRANADILKTETDKAEFRTAYQNGFSMDYFFFNRFPDMDIKEINHRLGRYGLNPCVTGDTWVHTINGPKKVISLIGEKQNIFVDGKPYETTDKGFFCTGKKQVLKLTTKEGFNLKVTGNHLLLKISKQTQKKQYTEWVEAQELKSGDKLKLQSHIGIQKWRGNGTENEGWLLGNLIGDGCFSLSEGKKPQAHLRYWGDSQEYMKDFALNLVNQRKARQTIGIYSKYNGYWEINSTELASLAETFDIRQYNKTITDKVEETSFEFHCGFLRGLFDADGSVQGSQEKGISIRLSQSNLDLLLRAQRMLLRLGISSTIYKNRRPEQVKLLPNSKKELAHYNCKAQHELVISKSNLPIFNELIGFIEPHKKENLTNLLSSYKRKINKESFTATIESITIETEEETVYDCTVPDISCFDANGFVAHNCGEICMNDNFCNLAEVHLNQIAYDDYEAQDSAFTAAALSVASLLHHKFTEERYQYSREIDPIVGVSFTGLFDFFVNALGVEWLQWWEAGRPEHYRLEVKTPQGIVVENGAQHFKELEANYLKQWREIVEETVWSYCDKHNLRRPNRCTTTQPAGTKSLLTNASPGWHPPKAQRFIRRITFGKNDPVALACLDYGYNVIPAQSDRDEHGNLLNDPFDPRCTEWLVEIPTEVPWANLEGANTINISKFSALAQFDFYMQVQKYYTAHNTSATIEFTEDEIEPLGTRIYEAIQNDEGYISAALLARFESNQTFPRLPFEPISKSVYEELQQGVMARRKSDDFLALLNKYDTKQLDVSQSGPAGCDSDKCLMPLMSK